ncbi:MAG: phosphoenolpyruvate--protein phosphotransferase [Planctomycetia bacterium]|nr:phosphoenolpyruvate--protein phosphotransferase [Planctomycetia bacterium]
MKTYQGIAVSPGITLGEVMVIDNGRCRVNRRSIERRDIAAEELRLDAAIEATTSAIARNRDSVTQELGLEYGQIFEAHLQILSDSRLKKEILQHIRSDLFSVEYAVSVVFDKHAEMLSKIQGGDLSERASDIIDIENRLLRQLMGIRKDSIATLTRPVIIFATELTPSETVNLDRKNILGIVTERGGMGSHTAIVASALQIPAVLGVGRFLNEVEDDDLAVVDGKTGLVILNPDSETVRKFELQQKKEKSFKEHLHSLSHAPAVTRDGTEIAIYGNIEFPYEARFCLENGADGIGLYRTEFLYLAASPEDLPDEEMHFEAYRKVAEDMGDRPVTIRTFDLGSDKMPAGVSLTREAERNPFMGLRSIRLSLKNTSMFRKQLRAILRASAYGKFRIMFPLVSTLLEFRHAKMLFGDVCEELEEEDVPFDKTIPLGMMVEVPSAVIMLGTFVPEVDFFSVGTNDLVQYTLAVDRSNKEVCSLYNSEDPALLRLIRQSIRVASMYDKPISLCGQMSSNPIYTMLLLGLGLRQFSVSPGAILEIKEMCRSVTIAECRELARNVMFMETAREIRNYLKHETARRVGEEFDSLEF